MFSDESQAIVECPSVWQVGVKTRDKETETPAITRYQRGLQTTRRKEAECQTDSFMYVQEEISVDSSEVDVELLQALKRLEPVMCRELEQAARSTVFDAPGGGRGGGFFGGASAGGVGSDGAAAIRLSVQCSGGVQELEGLPVTALSWSATGAFVAAGLGRTDHQDWCLHRAAVCVWNAAASTRGGGQDQPQQQPLKPHAVFETSSCVQSVQYHPSNPSLLAGGTFTGELLVWNVAASQEGEQLLASSMGAANAASAAATTAGAQGGNSGGGGGQDVAHREPVVEVLWVKKPTTASTSAASAASSTSTSRDHLLTAGSDGLLLLWQLDSRRGALSVANAYRLTAKSLPKSLRVRTGGRSAGVGVTCARIIPAKSSATALTLAVGCDSGVVLLCRVKPRPSNKKDAAVAEQDSLLDPTVRSIDCGVLGSVLGLDSLTHPAMLLVCGLSGACAMYSVAAESAAASAGSAASSSANPPLLCLETSAGAAYGCVARQQPPGLVAIATEQFGVLLYALVPGGGTSTPVAVLSHQQHSQSAPQQQQRSSGLAVRCVQWGSGGWLAAGGSDGQLTVWQVAEPAAKAWADPGRVAEFLEGLVGGGVKSAAAAGSGEGGAAAD